MALENASTANDYPKHKMSQTQSSSGFKFTPGFGTEVADLKYGADNPDILVPTSTQEYPLGSMLERGVEKWVYCHGSGTLAIGAPVQSAKAVHADQQEDIAVAQAQAIGDTSVYLTSTADLDGSPNETANNFAGGFLIVNDAAGEGQCCMIKSNAAFSGTEDSQFQLYDKLTIALTTSSQCGLVKSPFNDVVATEAVLTGKVVGVPQMAVTDGYYFWCKCGGPADVLMHAACALGTKVVCGTTAAKADPASCDTTEITIGEMLTPGITDGEHAMVWLSLGY